VAYYTIKNGNLKNIVLYTVAGGEGNVLSITIEN